MALQAHPFHCAPEFAKIFVHRQARGAGSLPIAHRDIQYKIFGPRDKSIAHQAGNVISDGAIDRVLKIQHTQRRTRAQRQHQIARHEVAVHKDGRRLQDFGHDTVKRLLQYGLLFLVQRLPFVLGDIPIGKELQLAPQQRLVIRGQHFGAASQLQLHQRVYGLLE